ncbi:response regulator [Chloroflexota bacterium]
MKDENKTKENLINELAKMRQRVVEFEALETERKQLEEALQDAREYANSIVATVREPLVVLDANLKIISASRSFYQTFQVTPEETHGQLIYELGDRQWDIPRLRQLLEKILPQNTSFDDFEVEHEFLTIGRKVMLLNARKMYRQTTKVKIILLAIEDITERKQPEKAETILLAIEDITERKRMERVVQDARESRERVLQQELNLTSRLASIGEVAAGIAHEINNPLTGVIGFAEMLTQMDVPEDIKEAVEVIYDGAKRVAGIVERLLIFARRNRPDKEYVNINSIVTNIVEMRSYDMRNSNIEVTTQLASDLPRTMANIGQLQQVFLNIIINAEQAMASADGSGKLSFKTEKVDSSIRVSVADDGPGIARDSIDKLFDPFFTTKEADGGTGLGLSISYDIINEHGGKIYAKNTLGEGATFIIDLPIIAETKQPKMAEPSGKEPEKVTGAKIMVVDDEPHICRVLDRLLTQEGHEVETISNAQTALQRLNTEKYDLILLDIRMPGMNGIEFYNHLEEIDLSLQQKVVCITGDVISARNKAFLDEAGIPCLAKPFGVGELRRQVKLALGEQRNDVQTVYSYR